MLIKYIGPSPSVMIAPNHLAVHGEPFEVPDELGALLLEQDTFKAVPAAKVTKKSEED